MKFFNILLLTTFLFSSAAFATSQPPAPLQPTAQLPTPTIQAVPAAPASVEQQQQATPQQAPPTPAPRVAPQAVPQAQIHLGLGVINIEKLVNQSEAGRNATAQLDARAKALEEETASLEKALAAEENSILAQQGKISAQEFEAKRIAFEDKLKGHRNALDRKALSLEQSRTKALSELQAHIAKVAVEIAEQKRLRLIVDRAAVVILEQNLDVTADAMAKLNARVKSITVQ